MPKKGRILYVEDHHDTRVMMTYMLERAGYHVTGTTNITDALRLARSKSFDLYLLDHTFPDASGVTLCLAIREFDQDTPILFYSARAHPKEREEALKAGAQGYLVKPGDLVHIADNVEKLIEGKRRKESSK